MRLNLKQREIIDEYVKELHQRFPEIEFIDVVESPEGPDTLWILVTSPPNDERTIELVEFTGQKAIDILDNYGYHILVQQTLNDEKVTA